MDLSVFSQGYGEARSKFLEAATRRGARVRHWPHLLKSPDGEALATDTAWLGDEHAPKVLKKRPAPMPASSRTRRSRARAGLGR